MPQMQKTASTALPPRAEVPLAHTWNAESVFPTRADWQAEYTALNDAAASTIAPFPGHLSDSAEMLVAWLELRGSLMTRVGRLFMYARMEQSCNSTDQQAGAMVGQAGGLYSKLSALTAFTEPEILAIGWDTLRGWLDASPRLAIYRHYLENLFRSAEHIRSAEVEELLGAVSDPFQQTFTTWELLNNADMRFEPARRRNGEQVQVAQSNIVSLLSDPDRELRRSAWEHYADTYLLLKNTEASNLVANHKAAVFMTRARRYNSVLEARLSGDNIDPKVFHNLIDTFKKHLPVWHRYWAIRKRALKVETLEPWDIHAPLTQHKPVISFEQAMAWICQGMMPLGEEYVTTMQRGVLEQRWVDRYPNQGKTSSAFSSGVQGTYPFILHSYTDSLNSMSVLAHELGHSMHSYFTWQTQPNIYSDYSIFVAEVASNFNQAMVRAYLFRTQTDPAFQIPLIEEAMYNFHRYFFLMPTLARFEWEVHNRLENDRSVTADDLIALMTDLFEEAYGGQMNLDRERVGITWAQFVHMYMNFYVFQYATGISGAHSLAKRILDGVPGAAEAYLGFLKAGSSGYPLDVLRQAGVDLTTPEAVETTFGVLTEHINRLDSLIE